VSAQPPDTRSTGLDALRRKRAAFAAPNRYLVAGSTAGSCLLEGADDDCSADRIAAGTI
jgi:hypothetical protein